MSLHVQTIEAHTRSFLQEPLSLGDQVGLFLSSLKVLDSARQQQQQTMDPSIVPFVWESLERQWRDLRSALLSRLEPPHDNLVQRASERMECRDAAGVSTLVGSIHVGLLGSRKS